jgi:hypothetical protein
VRDIELTAELRDPTWPQLIVCSSLGYTIGLNPKRIAIADRDLLREFRLVHIPNRVVFLPPKSGSLPSDFTSDLIATERTQCIVMLTDILPAARFHVQTRMTQSTTFRSTAWIRELRKPTIPFNILDCVVELSSESDFSVRLARYLAGSLASLMASEFFPLPSLVLRRRDQQTLVKLIFRSVDRLLIGSMMVPGSTVS